VQNPWLWALVLSVGSATFWLNREYNAFQRIAERTIDPLAHQVDAFIHIVTNDLMNPQTWDIGTVLGFSILILIAVFVVYNLKEDNDIKTEQVRQEHDREKKALSKSSCERVHPDEFRDQGITYTDEKVQELIKSQDYKNHMAKRDRNLSTNWQKVYRESGQIYMNNRSTLKDPPEGGEAAEQALHLRVVNEIAAADDELREER